MNEIQIILAREIYKLLHNTFKQSFQTRATCKIISFLKVTTPEKKKRTELHFATKKEMWHFLASPHLVLLLPMSHHLLLSSAARAVHCPSCVRRHVCPSLGAGAVASRALLQYAHLFF